MKRDQVLEHVTKLELNVMFIYLARVVQRVDKLSTGYISMLWIVQYVFFYTYPLDSDLSVG